MQIQEAFLDLDKLWDKIYVKADIMNANTGSCFRS